MIEIATLGMGCFWCSEAIFGRVKGVATVIPGYSGGNLENPTYEQVCTGKTGHAEVVQIRFDNSIIPYGDLLDVFFSMHDPTQKDRQGPDVGSQYRSIILYHTEEQFSIASNKIKQLNRILNGKVCTELKRFERFYPAEEYHVRYYERNFENPYCYFIIRPKLSKLREKFESLVVKSIEHE